MAIRVVVIVSAGNVQDCYADQKDVEIEMIDFDNCEEEGKAATAKADARAKVVDQTMHHVY